MKKILMLMGGIALLTMTACSEDDPNTAPSTSGILVKRIVYEDDDPDGYAGMVTYTYDGNKLIKGVWEDGSEEKFYYTGDLITKVEYIVDGEVDVRDTFTYNASGMLSEYRSQDFVNDAEDRSTYTLVNATTVTVTGYDGVGDTTPNWTKTLSYTNDELTQVTYPGSNTYTYTYDGKSSPFKNVIGYAAIAYTYSGDHEMEGRVQNIATIRNETEDSNYITNTYTYNADNYPLSATSTAIFYSGAPDDVSTVNVQYFYE